jgi:hypothetical protein
MSDKPIPTLWTAVDVHPMQWGCDHPDRVELVIKSSCDDRAEIERCRNPAIPDFKTALEAHLPSCTEYEHFRRVQRQHEALTKELSIADARLKELNARRERLIVEAGDNLATALQKVDREIASAREDHTRAGSGVRALHQVLANSWHKARAALEPVWAAKRNELIQANVQERLALKQEITARSRDLLSKLYQAERQAAVLMGLDRLELRPEIIALLGPRPEAPAQPAPAPEPVKSTWAAYELAEIPAWRSGNY